MPKSNSHSRDSAHILLSLRNRIGYDPLLWGLDAVSVCLVHHCPLSTRCPNPEWRVRQRFGAITVSCNRAVIAVWLSGRQP
jgi:hypothetical protein